MSVLDSGYLNTLLGNRIAEYLGQYLPTDDLVTKVGMDGLVVGKTVNIPLYDTFTVNSVTSSTVTESTVNNPDTSSQALTIDQDKAIDQLIPEIDVLQTSVDLQESFARGAANAMAATIWNSLIALKSGFTATDIGASTDIITENHFKQARQILAVNKAPKDQPWFFIGTPTQYTVITAWDRWKYDAPGSPFVTGSAPSVLGFRCYETQDSSLNGNATTGTQYGIFGCKSMWAIAYSKVPTVNFIDDQIRYYGVRAQVRCIYGVKLVRAALGVEIASSADVVD